LTVPEESGGGGVGFCLVQLVGRDNPSSVRPSTPQEQRPESWTDVLVWTAKGVELPLKTGTASPVMGVSKPQNAWFGLSQARLTAGIQTRVAVNDIRHRLHAPPDPKHPCIRSVRWGSWCARTVTGVPVGTARLSRAGNRQR